MDTHPESAAEFIKSKTKSFTDFVVFLQHENEKTSSHTQRDVFSCGGGSGGGGGGGGSEIVDSGKLQVENAARVALVLTRAFVDLCSVSQISHGQTDHHISSLELDDFFINLDDHGSHHNTPSYVQQQRHDDQSSSLGNCGDDDQYLNQLMSEEEEEVKDRNGKALGLGYFSLNNEPPPARRNNVRTVSKEIGTINREAGGHAENGDRNSPPFNNGACTVEPSTAYTTRSFENITLYGMDIISPTKMNDPQQQNLQHYLLTPMRTLGKLLYAVFYRGQPPPSSIFVVTNKPSTSPFREDSQYRFSRSLRGTPISVFSQLVDGKAIPVSICRLLSDLIDNDDQTGNNTNTPFNSFEDVIQELEHMISHPQIFLHDTHLSRGVIQHSPIFGQVYYGREQEVAQIIKVAAKMKQTSLEADVGVEAVFVSGIAGSGKSQLVQTASDYLSKFGWTFVKAKFERGAEHASRGILLSMFDGIVYHLVKMKERGASSDVAVCEKVSKSMLENIGHDGLSSLVDFLPSLPLLFDGIDNGERSVSEDWQLIYSLAKILELVIVSGQRIMICCDDLQWADRTSLSMIAEVLAKLGESLRQACQCCLFIGLYREDEVDGDHPLSIQYSYLQMSATISTTEIKLSSLSKKDVADMITAELQLPTRIVRELADIVYKKTSGHAFFVVELLNSLLRDSTIAFSPRKRRYAWDLDNLDLIQTGESVAELIASNVSCLPEGSQRILNILSCFGIQTDIPLLQILEQFQEGLQSSLNTFIEMGILDRAGPIIIFAHDLIQQSVYESMAVVQRQVLHLKIGRFLGDLASDSVMKGMAQLQLNDHTFFAGKSLTSSLISIACDQIDSAGPDAIDDNCLSLQFAGWNLCAGQKTCHQCDFRAALYYFSEGIAFLGKECWLNDLQLCRELSEGAVFASFALGEVNHVIKYAEDVISHVSFEDTLKVQTTLLKSLAQSGRHKECITRGINILRQLDFGIPQAPTKEIVKDALSSTDIIASKYSIDQIMALCEQNVEESAHSIVKIMDAFYISCYASASPFLPLISCELVKYSLTHGVCQESAVAFASYGMFKIFFDEDYSVGKKMAKVVRAITKKHQALNKSNSLNFDFRAHILLFITIDIWFSSPTEVSRRLLHYHDGATRTGQSDLAMISLQMGWRYLLYCGGKNLAMILNSSEERTELIAQHSNYATKYIALDNALLEELTGQSVDCSSIEGMVCNMKDLQTEAESVNNTRLLHHIHFNNLMLAYWRGDYEAAEKSSHLAWKFPTAKMPSIVLIFHTFFGGLIAFRLFRDVLDGDRDNRLKEGIEMMNRMAKWAQNSIAVFENKWLLLKAELAASTGKYDEAMKLYMASIAVARDHGNIHELGLAYVLLGNCYSSRKWEMDAKDCFQEAYECFNQWGAMAVAERIFHDHDLNLDAIKEVRLTKSKRAR